MAFDAKAHRDMVRAAVSNPNWTTSRDFTTDYEAAFATNLQNDRQSSEGAALVGPGNQGDDSLPGYDRDIATAASRLSREKLDAEGRRASVMIEVDLNPEDAAYALAAAIQLLSRYGRHTPTCSRPRRPYCDCGWENVEKLIR